MGRESFAAAGLDQSVADAREAPADRFLRVRRRSEELAAGLSPEDQCAQSMADASPVKWHLGHTTWFFEQMLLRPASTPADPAYDLLFNSYYESLGPRIARSQRGLLTRPSLAEILSYRRRVDASVLTLLEREFWAPGSHGAYLFELALHHEQQHQELMLTDILHLFAQSPLAPAYAVGGSEFNIDASPLRFFEFAACASEVGAAGQGFAFDNETPRHAVTLRPFQLADRLTTNGEWRAFMADGGYERPDLWMSDGWACAQQEGWRAPLYWTERDGEWVTMTLTGRQRVDPSAPVVHISWYEADAFARWSQARLPTEAEWETVAASVPITGNLAPEGSLQPAAAKSADAQPRQMFGDVWEWTASPYLPYPGFEPTPGTASEYNGKFMINQMVLRGGSFATPRDHIRATYRNFFHPHQRWQFMGVRLAKDLTASKSAPEREERSHFLDALQQGLKARPKTISPKWFYDRVGSALFEEITALPEYYLTRTETSLLRAIAPELASTIPRGAAMVEFGSGASEKTRVILDAAPHLSAYVPLDISREALRAAGRRIALRYPRLNVVPVVADFTQAVDLPSSVRGRPLVGFFPGSTIGNFTHVQAQAFLRSVRALLGRQASLIVGVDLVKSSETLLAAYNDAQGVTAAFNKNILARANRELGSDFDLDAFSHEARWNEEERRIEMHLVSRKAQTVLVGDQTYRFEIGDTLHTENAHKFSVREFEELARSSGWRVAREWTSPAPHFAVFVLGAE